MPSQTALNGGKVEAAYTIMSGTGTQVHGGVDDSNTFGINYRALFGGNTVDPGNRNDSPPERVDCRNRCVGRIQY